MRASWTVVAGSGTDELRGLRGQGGFVASEGTPTTPYTFDYSISSDSSPDGSSFECSADGSPDTSRDTSPDPTAATA